MFYGAGDGYFQGNMAIFATLVWDLQAVISYPTTSLSYTLLRSSNQSSPSKCLLRHVCSQLTTLRIGESTPYQTSQSLPGGGGAAGAKNGSLPIELISSMLSLCVYNILTVSTTSRWAYVWLTMSKNYRPHHHHHHHHHHHVCCPLNSSLEPPHLLIPPPPLPSSWTAPIRPRVPGVTSCPI